MRLYQTKTNENPHLIKQHDVTKTFDESFDNAVITINEYLKLWNIDRVITKDDLITMGTSFNLNSQPLKLEQGKENSWNLFKCTYNDTYLFIVSPKPWDELHHIKDFEIYIMEY